LSVSKMTKIALLSAFSIVLMFFELPLPFFPEFLKIDASDLPALVGGFALGPLSGVAIVLFKNLLHMFQTTSAYVGEVANFVVGTALVFPASLYYMKHKTKKSAIVGLVIGTVCMAIVGALVNYFVMIPLYAKLFGMDIEAIVAFGTMVNKNITNLNTLILFAIVPFNLIKGFAVSLITILIYKYISPILHKGLQ